MRTAGAAVPWRPQEKLRQYRYLYVAPSPQRGLGLFTSRPAVAGGVVLRVDDPEYLAGARPYAQLRDLGYTYGEVFQVDDDLFIPPYGGLDDFTNHSCDPNCGLRVSPRGFDMVALRDILADEELTYDYSTHQEHPEDEMLCQCGTAICRGVIGRFSGLPLELQRRYILLGVVSHFAAAAASPKLRRRRAAARQAADPAPCGSTRPLAG